MNSHRAAIIVVRRDIEQEGYTQRGAYQENVCLDLEIVSGYVIYRME